MLIGQCIIAEAGDNWYLLDINIYTLYEKTIGVEKMTQN
jgi:hypothetical protein